MPLPLKADTSGPAVDFPITIAEFRSFRDLFYRKTGMLFADGKRYFVDRRIADRAAARGSATFREYFGLLRGDTSGAEFQELVNLLTVNETYFFRESYQFDALAKVILPEIAARRKPGAIIRILSLPCSTGEEPYSIAISLLEGWPQSDHYNIDILGADIDTNVIAASKLGIYSERSLLNVSPELRRRYFRPHGPHDLQIISELRSSIGFFQLNISDKSAMARIRDVDVVFCRNMLIYFDDPARDAAIAAIGGCLSPGGLLFLGHSESLSRSAKLFEPRRLGDSVVYERTQGER